MIIIGLTGSIGMGKSTVAAMFRQNGIPVFDADAAVHRLYATDRGLRDRIEQRFPGTTSATGIDRQRLGVAVVGNPAALAALERLIHPEVSRVRRAFLRLHRARPMVVLDIPLLFEKRGWRDVDVTVVVSAPQWMQRRRVLARSAMTSQKFRALHKLQMPDHLKRRRADIVIETGRQANITRAQVRHVIACIRARRAQY